MRPKWQLQAVATCFLLSAAARSDTVEVRQGSDDVARQPRIITQDGHLVFQTGENHNITFRSALGGFINIDGVEVSALAQTVQASQQLISDMQSRVERSITTLQQSQAESDATSQRRLDAVDRQLSSLNRSIDGRPQRRVVEALQTKVATLETQVASISNGLAFDNCASNPCSNGGSCIDMYNSYRCFCPANWQGPRCDVDINECSFYAGSSLGCDRGQCRNFPGGFTCICNQGYIGVLCNIPAANGRCATQSSSDLCGHGTCVDQQGGSFVCFCDEGWTRDTSTPAKCVVDKDECSEGQRCYPGVQCINVPGGFHCGPCPRGYSGNGRSCTDVNECAVANGGCSLNPTVECINTPGSSSCGPCPRGYAGNGRLCAWVGVCGTDRGGCSPDADCVENPALPNRICQCRRGFTGVGEGPMGCTPVRSFASCSPNPCIHGTCALNPFDDGSYTCTCAPGYSGQLCDRDIDECSAPVSPCLNEATCVNTAGSYRCICLPSFTGANCERNQPVCGGDLRGDGNFSFPQVPGYPYLRDLSCAWTVTVDAGKILRITMPSFRVQPSSGCQNAFVQVHDGGSASAAVLGKFCDSSPVPRALRTTRNTAYVWFRASSLVSTDSFTVSWTSAVPPCGGDIRNQTSGVITSPGYPGQYPPDSLCIWTIVTMPGYDISFVPSHLAMEVHADCSYDYLEIRNGLRPDGTLLQKYCTSTDARAFATSGNEAFLKFSSDGSVSDAGFRVAWSTVRSACGGTLTTNTGTVSSPGYPNHYPANRDCIYVISLGRSSRVILTFNALATENSATCDKDWLEVRDGSDGLAPLFGLYCGSSLPPQLRSSSNSLYLKFHSDSAGQGAGFQATWSPACGGLFTESSGSIGEQAFLDNGYSSGTSCDYVISAPTDYVITLSFVDLRMPVGDGQQCTTDYVQVRNGSSADSPLIGRFCGMQRPPDIISSSNALLVQFRGGSSTVNGGFLADYAMVSGADPDPGSNCGGLLTAPNGVISSPGHPNYYPHGSTCRWDIVVTPGMRIRLIFVFFSLESANDCQFDFVAIYDNSTRGGGLRGRYCGSSHPPTITSEDNILTVIFQTDGSVAYEGFSATYVAMNTTSCHIEITTLPAVITTPNFPNPYPQNKECIWIITAPEGHQISLNVTDFELEAQQICRYDMLEIRNGGLDTSPLIGTFCGTQRPLAPPRMMVAHGNKMFLKFKTDASAEHRGFRILVEDFGEGCGADLTSASGSFTSPNYPSAYGHNAECYWTIQAAQGSAITLTFVDMQIEQHPQCVFDYVEIIAGRRSGPNLGRYCGASLPQPLVSPGNQLLVRFRTDSSATGRGFHAVYAASCSNRLLTASSGAIESPNFPNPYPIGQECSWIIKTTRGNTLNVSFSHFQLESEATCSHDRLEVRDGETASAPLIGVFCGSDLPARMASTAASLFIRFHSDASLAYSGFRLEWITNGCGQQLTAASGNFTSPGYPTAYPHHRECIWTITVAEGSAIELTIRDFELEVHSNCDYDALEVFGGMDRSAPALAKLCGLVRQQMQVTSTSNAMYLRFFSDVSNTGRGFSASYRSISDGCGGSISTPNGVIVSKNYPGWYPNNVDCIWNIAVAPGQTVRLQFLEFDIESGDDCVFDYVSVYDGSSDDAALLLNACGPSLPNNSTLVSTNNTMRIRMRTDSSRTGRGFKANFTTGCGGYRSADEDGSITSPSYPDSYPSYTNCTWIITASQPADRITVQFSRIDLDPDTDCNNSGIRVLQGDNVGAPQQGLYCGNRVPAAITSLGNSLAVQMYSGANTLQYTGFRLTYSKASSFCGGNLASEHGAFTSPSYPLNYPATTECIWTLEASAGSGVMLTFTTFDLQPDPDCNNDYVEIRDGGNLGRFLGRFCGSTLPTNVTYGHSLWVKFRSDDSISGLGFVAQYSMAFGGSLAGPSGSVASPQYPLQYPHNAEYSWTIATSVGSAVRITFVELDMESGREDCPYDYVRFLDGSLETGPTLGTYCGRHMPRPVTSSSNLMTVLFHSDGSSSGRGFMLNWREVPVSAGQPPTTSPPTPVAGCGGTLTATGQDQNLTSPNYPDNYPHNLRCVWTITSPELSRIRLQVADMLLEPGRDCRFDALNLYNGYMQLRFATFLGRFCGRLTSPIERVSRTNVMSVFFVSDSSSAHRGFRLSYRQACGGYSTASTGTIQSSPDDGNCTWTVEVTAGRTIEFSFPVFNLQGLSDCTTDYILLLNGGNNLAPPLGPASNGRYCGSEAPGRLNTTSNLLYVQYVSSGSSTFKLQYTEKQVACGGRLYLSDDNRQGELTSPGYPERYPQNVDCEWIITILGYQVIQLDFDNQFDIENHVNCNFDFVELRDGGTPASPLLGRFCGSAAPGTQRSSGNIVYIRFRTDNSMQRKGFKISYKISTCGGTLVGGSGEITSPNYPQSAGANLDCQWLINGPVGHYLTFSFDSFSLPSTPNCTGGDYLEIQNRNSTGHLTGLAGPLLCGLSAPTAISTSDSFAHIRFVTDRSTAGTHKFHLRFNASVEECGGDLITPSGTFTSPNFPGQYPHSRVCTWRITVTPGRRVSLFFNEYDIEAQRDCIFDYIEVRNGILPSSPRLRRYCGSADAPTAPIQSSGNTMSVIFTTDGSVTNRGFQATYSSDSMAECGGEINGLAGRSGLLSAPSVNGTYAHSVQCIWIIRNREPQPGSIVLRFRRLHLEPGPDCIYDYVEMREGLTYNGPLIGKFCGNLTSTYPPQITTPSEAVWVNFGTDSSVALSGFELSYSFSRCGGMLTAVSGVITSPNFPNSYGHNEDCSWEISVAAGSQIEITFTNFLLEEHDKCLFDAVTIFNGGSQDSPVARTLCGTNSQGPFVSQSNRVRIEFHSDNSMNATGFRLEYTSRQSGCGGNYHSNVGSLATPSWPGRYPSNVECVWDISVQPGYHVQLDFGQVFDVAARDGRCTRDYVSVTDMGNEDIEAEETELGRFCGQLTPRRQVSSGNRVLVKFHSEATAGGNGFSANWAAGCGATIEANTDSSGLIVSPGFPQNYAHNLSCVWKIQAMHGQFIILQFDPQFGLEGAGQSACRYDYVQVFQGNDTRPPNRLLGRFCGSTAPQPLSARGSMTLQFVTDRDTTDKGWKARYTITECGGVLTGSSGSISSPTHPAEYHNNLNCSWSISVPGNRSVELRFDSFGLENSGQCRYDYVELRDGDSPTNSTLLGRFCGTTTPPPVRTVSPTLTVVFVTDGSVTSEGFTASYQAVLGERQGCGGDRTGTPSGIIRPPESPNAPGEYAPDVDCVWTVIVDDSKVVRLNISNMDMESSVDCLFDYLEVRDGFAPDSPVIAKLCGGASGSQTFAASSSSVRIRFVSDDSAHGTGFTIAYDSIDPLCGGRLSATEVPRQASSPGYPILPASSMRCRWIISAPRRQSVRVVVTAMSLPPSDGCSSHYLQMQEPRSRAQAEVAPRQDLTYCGTEIPQLFETRGDVAVVSFVTSDNPRGMTYRGVQFNYSIASCSRNYAGDSGRIVSPRWPGPYPPNVSCDLTVTVPLGSRLSLFFNMLAIEFHNSCNHDYLSITDGSGPNVTKVCGFSLPPPYFAVGNVAYLKFVTDNSVAHGGFDITYTSSPSGCGGNLTGDAGSFTSPAYPRTYPANTTCVWQIRTSQQTRPILVINTLDILQSPACMRGYVEVRLGDSSSSPLVGRYCSGDRPVNFTATTNAMYVKFLSGPQATGTGFRATFSTGLRSTGGSLTRPLRPRRPWRGWFPPTQPPLSAPEL